MATTDPRDDRQMFGTGDLALFLGGGEDSFTGLLLVLIGKARATPGDYSRLKFAFPREVRAWETWMAMSPAPTFAQLREALQEQDAETAAEGLGDLGGDDQDQSLAQAPSFRAGLAAFLQLGVRWFSTYARMIDRGAPPQDAAK